MRVGFSHNHSVAVRFRRSARSRWGIAAVVLTGALVLRAVFVLATPDYQPRLDPADYLRLGVAIAASGVYPTMETWVTRRGCSPVGGVPRAPCVTKPRAAGAHLFIRPTAYRSPAYPYALAVPELGAKWLGGDRLAFARAFQVLIGGLDVALIGLLALLLWGRRVGFLALTLAAVYFPLILVSGTLVSEPLYVAFMLGSVCAILWWRERGDFALVPAAGVLAGLALLTRTNGIVVVIVVLILAGTSDRTGRGLRRLRPAVVVLVCAALTTVPWLVRNAVVFGRLAPLSTETGETLVGTYNSTARSDRVDPGAWRTLRHIPRYASMRAELAARPETTVDAVLRRDALAFAAAHPGYVMSVIWHNLLRLAELDGFRRTRFGGWTIGLTGAPAVAGAFAFYLVALLALVGALLRPTPRAPWAFWFLPVLQLLSTVVVIGETPRFRTPLEPFILVLSAVALERLSGRVGHHVRAGRRSLSGAMVPIERAGW